MLYPVSELEAAEGGNPDPSSKMYGEMLEICVVKC